MIVDDDPAIVRLLSQVLEGRFGDQVRLTALTDPVEASQWIDTHDCNILLSDIEMPGIDGLRLLEIAKARNAWTQVVFLTGCSTWDRIDHAIQHGASDYLLKPLDTEEVVEVFSQRIQQAVRWQSAVRDTLASQAPEATLV